MKNMDISTFLATIASGTASIVLASSISGAISKLAAFLYLKSKNQTVELLKSHTLNEVAKEMLANGELSHSEYYKLDNLSKVAEKADVYYAKIKEGGKSDDSDKQKFDVDWYLRFFECVGNIGNEELQDIWAKVIGGAPFNKGGFSLRALETLYNMTPNEAGIFDTLMPFVTFSGSMYFIIYDDFFSSTFGAYKSGYNPMQKDNILEFDKILLMEECGLLKNLPIAFDTAEIKDSFEIGNDEILGVITKKKKSKQIEISGYALTSIGIQFYDAFSIVNKAKMTHGYDDEACKKDPNLYFLLCLNGLKKKYKDIEVRAHLIKQPYDRNDVSNRTVNSADLLTAFK